MKTYRKVSTKDVAYSFRMGAGFPGDVNRTHPASIEPTLIDASAAPQQYGQAVLMDPTTQGVRPAAVGDQSDATPLDFYGTMVRPYPLQAPAGSSNAQQGLGAALPPQSGVCDVLRLGYTMVQLNVGSTAPVKNGKVYVWCAATSGNHIQGGYETAFSAGNTVEVANARFMGGMDTNSVAELVIGLGGL